MQESFDSLEMRARLCRDIALMKAHVLIDWDGLRPLLREIYKREASCGGGEEPTDPVLVLKANLLSRWHSLSNLKSAMWPEVGAARLVLVGALMGRSCPPYPANLARSTLVAGADCNTQPIKEVSIESQSLPM